MKIVSTVSIRTPTGRFPQGSMVAVLSAARNDLAADTAKSFDRAADPVNFKPWPKRKKQYPWAPLQKTGTLRTRAVASCKAATINGATLKVTVDVPDYGKFHMTGTKIMAARRFVGVSLKTRNALRKRLKKQAVKIFATRTVI